MHPDGGIARLRVHGEPMPEPAFLDVGTVDLAALENGGRVVGCSNLFYSSPNNLVSPGLARSMGEGWETARRRDDGNDWVLLRLAGAGVVRLAELDTTHFKGNAPGSAALTGFDVGSRGAPADDERDGERGELGEGFELLARTRLQPDTRHRFLLPAGRAVTHVRLDVYPDGGMARVRLLGDLTPDGRAALGLRWFSALPEPAARQALEAAGVDPATAEATVAGRPADRPRGRPARRPRRDPRAGRVSARPAPAAATGHVLVAPDKFKGTLSAAGVGAAVRAGLLAVHPDLDVRVLPVADGGDGMLAAALGAGFRRVPVTVTGPLGERVAAAIAVRDEVAVVELALASGLVLVPEDERDALAASSFGAGELVAAALDQGCTQVVLGVGGSASTDGGAGLLQALGARFLDHDGDELPPGGGALLHLAEVDLSGLDWRLDGVEVVLASDVDNPLLGPRGAAHVYGPQKGASPDDVERLDVGLGRLADALDPGAADLPGAGAAGGVGFAALSVLRATAEPGIDVVLDLVGFKDQLEGARLVVTGEGRLDEQTLHGKAPAGVADAAGAAGVPVVAVCGRLDLSAAQLHSAGFTAAYALTDVEPDVAACRADPAPLLELLGRRIAEDHLGTGR